GGRERPALADRQHTFAVRATDLAGNTDTTPAMRGWTVDDTDPDTSLDDTPTDPSGESAATFVFSSPEIDATFLCELDGGGMAACSSPRTYVGLGDGAHTFSVRALDPAGNVDPSPALFGWDVDSTLPTVAILSGPVEGSAVADTGATFTFSSPDAGVTFECDLDGAGWLACTSPHVLAGLAQGERAFGVRARLVNAGAPAERGWTVDTVLPDTTVESGPPDPDNDGTPSFTFGSDEAPVTYECDLDGGGFAPCSNPHTTAPLADGPHTLDVRATDEAGNTDASSAGHAWTVDTAAPDTTIDSGPAEGSVVPDNTPTFTFGSTDGGATFSCRVDGAGWAACVSPHTLAALADGAHTFLVRATDPLGNTDPTPASRAFTVDTVAPDTLITTPRPPDPTADNSPTFTFVANEVGATFECDLDGAGAWAVCASPHATGALADGARSFSVRAVDVAGNKDGTPDLHAWTIDTTPPDTTLDSSPPDPDNDATPTFAFSADEGGATFECDLDSGGFAACTSPHTTAALGDGPHTFEVRASDALGNTDPTPAISAWTLDSVAPTAGTVADGLGADEDWQDTNTTYDANWSGFFDPEGPLLRYDWALGTTPGADDSRAWEDVGLATSASATGLSLATGVTHYASVRAVDLAGNTVVASSDGLTINAASLLGTADPHASESYGDIWGEGDIAYLGHFTSTGGVDIFDVSVPTAPVLLTQWFGSAGGNQIKDVKVADGIGYFGSDNGAGVYVVDVSVPSAPVEIARITAAMGGHPSIHNLFLDNGFLYEASGRGPDIHVFDVSVPAAPVFVRTITVPSGGVVHDITVVEGRLYTSVISAGGWTDIYDISAIGTGAPLLGSFASGGSTHANWPTAGGGYLVVAQETSGGDVTIWDIGDPGAAFLVATIDPAVWDIDSFSAHNVLVMGDLLFVSWYQAGVQVFDISDPTDPKAYARYDTYPGAVVGFAGNWGVYPFLGLDRVLASDISTGLYVIDFTASP
ncbi:hypothetical protein IIA16_05100, partial [bacterium]|nr:hypothetical protein [bacterium]